MSLIIDQSGPGVSNWEKLNKDPAGTLKKTVEELENAVKEVFPRVELQLPKILDKLGQFFPHTEFYDLLPITELYWKGWLLEVGCWRFDLG